MAAHRPRRPKGQGGRQQTSLGDQGCSGRRPTSLLGGLSRKKALTAASSPGCPAVGLEGDPQRQWCGLTTGRKDGCPVPRSVGLLGPRASRGLLAAVLRLETEGAGSSTRAWLCRGMPSPGHADTLGTDVTVVPGCHFRGWGQGSRGA